MGPQALYDAIKGLRWDLIGLHIVGVNMISNYDIFLVEPTGIPNFTIFSDFLIVRNATL